VVFPGEQESTWTYDEEAGAYYFHRFYEHQPDLNIANPAVREEICKIMGFWLELGVSGFRVDAAPFLIELRGIPGVDDVDPYQYLREFREYLSWRRGDAILLAEANVAMDKIPAYFGEGTKMHMLFNFMLNQYVFLAFARQQAAPLREGFHLLPQMPASGQWANFLRNHDELDLGRLQPAQRQEVFQAFAPEAHMQLYQRGIRRRLAPMFDGDLRRLELAYSLMFTLPGTPIMRYGDEIGMGDDLSLEERTSIRTLMQWSDEKNGDFSSAASDRLIRPIISGGPYGFERLNVAGQRRDPNSLLNWMERAIRMRKECPEIGWGAWRLVDTNDPAVFAHSCAWRDGLIIAVHNLSDKGRTICLDLQDYQAAHLIDLIDDQQKIQVNGEAHQVELKGYGYRWFRVRSNRP
jgi:maltose alpha-D-glucosyltransferase/alpha-amylase